MRIGVRIHGRNWLSSSTAGSRMNSLLRSEPTAMRLMIGISRSAAMPCTYCGVTAVSSTTTPAAFALARPAAAPMSSTDAEAIRASVAMSSNRPNSPALMAKNLASDRSPHGGGLPGGLRGGLGGLRSGLLDHRGHLLGLHGHLGELHRLLDVALRGAERVDRVGQQPGDRPPGQGQRE